MQLKNDGKRQFERKLRYSNESKLGTHEGPNDGFIRLTSRRNHAIFDGQREIMKQLFSSNCTDGRAIDKDCFAKFTFTSYFFPFQTKGTKAPLAAVSFHYVFGRN